MCHKLMIVVVVVVVTRESNVDNTTTTLRSLRLKEGGNEKKIQVYVLLEYIYHGMFDYTDGFAF